MNFAQGIFMFNVDAGALNNLKNDKKGDGTTITRTKKIVTYDANGHRKTYVLVSAQSYNHFNQATHMDKFKARYSIKIKEGKKVNYEVDPVKYVNQDLRGYMETDQGLSRIAPFKFSHLISVNGVEILESFNTASTEGDNMIYQYEVYKTHFKGKFNIDLDAVGRFEARNKSGYQNINDDLIEKYEKEEEYKGIIHKIDKENKVVVLTAEERAKRVSEYLKSLNYIQGGAKLTNNFENIAPQFIILVIVESGNNILANVIHEAGEYGRGFKVNFEALKKMLLAYKDDLKSKVYIGRNEGYLDSLQTEIDRFIKEMSAEGIEVVNDIVKNVIDQFAEEIDAFYRNADSN
ncbi:type I-B CRISPR-associated protein Cas7/Cst2/DevR [Carboxydothermus ferrireducens]|uniref:CRISPR-associated protein Cst2 n=1 Tax=Carboxydothermus ferrireducens DSM 11255 TaxID=1119529 RepID=A0ABX2R995_9THEO|nr:type I-B CRISPR-associated protein Cas7/Cst2/DevR [Carboxydothermus ferrireducens]NYE56711.1 CRISPR-associated protein Cst2 [Carboxydothermus ferrireducens DSM 11255]